MPVCQQGELTPGSARRAVGAVGSAGIHAVGWSASARHVATARLASVTYTHLVFAAASLVNAAIGRAIGAVSGRAVVSRPRAARHHSNSGACPGGFAASSLRNHAGVCGPGARVRNASSLKPLRRPGGPRPVPQGPSRVPLVGVEPAPPGHNGSVPCANMPRVMCHPRFTWEKQLLPTAARRTPCDDGHNNGKVGRCV